MGTWLKIFMIGSSYALDKMFINLLLLRWMTEPLMENAGKYSSALLRAQAAYACTSDRNRFLKLEGYKGKESFFSLDPSFEDSRAHNNIGNLLHALRLYEAIGNRVFSVVASILWNSLAREVCQNPPTG